MKKGLQNEVYFFIFMILGTFLRSGSKGVPGWSQGPSQGQNCSKMGLKMTRKSSKILPAGFLKTLLKDTRTEHVSK